MEYCVRYVNDLDCFELIKRTDVDSHKYPDQDIEYPVKKILKRDLYIIKENSDDEGVYKRVYNVQLEGFNET